MNVSDVMTTNVQLANPETTLEMAATMMRDGDFGALPVGENDRLVGVVTDRDITIRGVAAGSNPKTATVRQVMSQGVRWVYDDASTDDAAKIMADQQIRRLPVVNRDKRLVGMISVGDFAVESKEIKQAAHALRGVSEGAQQHV